MTRKSPPRAGSPFDILLTLTELGGHASLSRLAEELGIGAADVRKALKSSELTQLTGLVKIRGSAAVVSDGWSLAVALCTAAQPRRIILEDDAGRRFEAAGQMEAAACLLPGDRVLLAARDDDPRQTELIGPLAAPERVVVCRVSQGAEARLADTRFCATLKLTRLPTAARGAGPFMVTALVPAREGGRFAPLRGRALESLGDAASPAAQLRAALARHDLPSEFPAAALREAEKLGDDPSPDEAGQRVDLRDIGLVTIDDAEARDFDDAVWCATSDSGWRLIVAIADVSHYVTPGSALDREAQRRLTSVYFPSAVIPMLPESLSNGLCSLRPGVDRAALACDMLIDRAGLITAYQFYPALIRSRARLTYEAVWTALCGDCGQLSARGGDKGDIDALFALYQTLRQARYRRGATDFESAETRITLGADGLIESVTRRDHNDAHRIIEECMLAANVCAADLIVRRRAASLFRVHEPPTAQSLAALRALLAGLGLKLGGGDAPTAADFGKVMDQARNTPLSEIVQLALLRSMRRAVYLPRNIAHYGLGYEAYTHFTSPIRRYPDLLVHRTIRALLMGQRYQPAVVSEDARALLTGKHGLRLRSEQRAREAADGRRHAVSEGPWLTLGLMSSAAERRADDASRDVLAWLKCRFIEGFAGQDLVGTVTAVIPQGLFVTLDDPYVEGFVRVSELGADYFEFDERGPCLVGRSSGRRYGPGARLTARLLSSDPENLRIDFTLSGTERATRPRRSRGGR